MRVPLSWLREFVEVPAEAADEVITAMRRTSLRGQRVSVRRDRDN